MATDTLTLPPGFELEDNSVPIPTGFEVEPPKRTALVNLRNEEAVKADTYGRLSLSDRAQYQTLTRLGRGTKTGFGRMVEGVGTADVMMPLIVPLDEFGRGMSPEWEALYNERKNRTPEVIQGQLDRSPMVQTGRLISQAAEREYPNIQPESVSNPIGAVAEGIGSTIPIAATALAAAPLGAAAPAAIAAAFFSESQDAFDSEMRRQIEANEKADPNKAFNKAMAYGAVSGALEYAGGAGRFIRNISKQMTEQEVKRGIGTFVLNRVKDAGAEGATEGLQRIAQDLIVSGDVDLAAALQEAAVGAGVGVTIGGVSEGTTRAIRAGRLRPQPEPTPAAANPVPPVPPGFELEAMVEPAIQDYSPANVQAPVVPATVQSPTAGLQEAIDDVRGRLVAETIARNVEENKNAVQIESPVQTDARQAPQDSQTVGQQIRLAEEPPRAQVIDGPVAQQQEIVPAAPVNPQANPSAMDIRRRLLSRSGQVTPLPVVTQPVAEETAYAEPPIPLPVPVPTAPVPAPVTPTPTTPTPIPVPTPGAGAQLYSQLDLDNPVAYKPEGTKGAGAVGDMWIDVPVEGSATFVSRNIPATNAKGPSNTVVVFQKGDELVAATVRLTGSGASRAVRVYAGQTKTGKPKQQDILLFQKAGYKPVAILRLKTGTDGAQWSLTQDDFSQMKEAARQAIGIVKVKISGIQEEAEDSAFESSEEGIASAVGTTDAEPVSNASEFESLVRGLFNARLKTKPSLNPTLNEGDFRSMINDIFSDVDSRAIFMSEFLSVEPAFLRDKRFTNLSRDEQMDFIRDRSEESLKRFYDQFKSRQAFTQRQGLGAPTPGTGGQTQLIPESAIVQEKPVIQAQVEEAAKGIEPKFVRKFVIVDDLTEAGHAPESRDVATVAPDGTVLIHRQNMIDALASFKDQEQAMRWLSQVLREEGIHAIALRVVSEKEAADLWNSVTALERRALIRAYTGRWQNQKASGYSDSQLGHELLRRQIQRMAGGATTEQIRAQGWSDKAIQTLINLVERVVTAAREFVSAQPLIARITAAMNGQQVEGVAEYISAPPSATAPLLKGEAMRLEAETALVRAQGIRAKLIAMQDIIAEKVEWSGQKKEWRAQENRLKQLQSFAEIGAQVAGVDAPKIADENFVDEAIDLIDPGLIVEGKNVKDFYSQSLTQLKADAVEYKAVQAARAMAALLRQKELLQVSQSVLDSNNPNHVPAFDAYTSDIGDVQKKIDAIAKDNPAAVPLSQEMLTQNDAGPIRNAVERAYSMPAIKRALVGPYEKLVEYEAQLRTLGQVANDGERQRIILEINNALDVFDYNLERFRSDYSVIEPILSQKIAEAMADLGKGKLDEVTARAFLESALNQTKTGVETQGLMTQQQVNETKTMLDAVQKFASKLGETLKTDTTNLDAKALLAWLNDPTATVPSMDWGSFMVGPSAKPWVVNAIQSAPPFKDAVLSLVKAYEGGIKALPSTHFTALAAALTASGGKVDESVQTIIKQVEAQANNSMTEADIASKTAARNLISLLTEQEAWNRAKELFDAAASDPAVNALRGDVRIRALNWRQMIKENHNQISFDGFTIPPTQAGDVAIIQEPMALSGRETLYTPEALKKLQPWIRRAELYVDEYEVALKKFDLGAAPHPEQLGFKTDIYNGLNEQLKVYKPVYEIGELLQGSPELKSGGGDIQRLEFFRTPLGVSERMPGIFGVLSRTQIRKLNELIRKINAVANGQKPAELIRLRQAAIKSHKFDPNMDGSQDSYRQFILNPLANQGRSFTKMPVAGETDPYYGFKYTKEDIEFLHAQAAYASDLQSIVSADMEHAIRTREGEKVFRRAPVPVGNVSTARYLNHVAALDAVVGQQERGGPDLLLTAYNAAPVKDIKPGDDISDASSLPIAVAWNALAKDMNVLAAYVLDSMRTDVSLRSSPEFLSMKRAFANEIAANGHTQMKGDGLNPATTVKLDDLQDLVDGLAKYYTGDTDARTYILDNLNREFRQYVSELETIQNPPRQEAEQTTELYKKLAKSEFNTEANVLRLPSVFYEYGILKNAEVRGLNIRATLEPMVELINTYNIAAQQLSAQIVKAQKAIKKNAVTGEKIAKELLPAFEGNVDAAAAFVKAIDKLHEQLHKPTEPSGAAEELLRTTATLWLAKPKTLVGNTMLAPFKSFFVANDISTANKAMNAARSLALLGRIAGKFIPYAIGRMGRFASERQQIAKALDYLKMNHPKVYRAGEKLSENTIQRWALNDYDAIQSAGLTASHERFRDIVRKEWSEIFEAATPQQVQAREKNPRWETFKGAARFGPKFIQASFSKLGMQELENIINIAIRQLPPLIEEELFLSAMKYGQARDTLGEYNPNDPAWLIKPEEFSNRFTENGRATNLQNARIWLETAGIPDMARLFWDAYQRVKKDPTAKLFNAQQRQAFEATFIEASNKASFANRPLAVRQNPWLRSFAIFHGYTADFLNDLVTEFRPIAGTPAGGKLMQYALSALGIFLVAGLYGFLNRTGQEYYQREAQGMQSPVDTPLELPEMLARGDWSRTAMLVAQLPFVAIPYLGTSIISTMGEAQGKRGWNPARWFVPVSVTEGVFNNIRSVYSNPANWDEELQLLFERNIPYGKEFDRAIGLNANTISRDAGNAFHRESKALGFLPPDKAFVPGAHGPTFGIKYDLRGALIDGDIPKAQQSAQALVRFYYERNIENDLPAELASKQAVQQSRRDYEMMNPAVAANNGKKPTEGEFAQVLSSMGAEDRQKFIKVYSAWRNGAALFGIDPASPALQPYKSEGRTGTSGSGNSGDGTSNTTPSNTELLVPFGRTGSFGGGSSSSFGRLSGASASYSGSSMGSGASSPAFGRLGGGLPSLRSRLGSRLAGLRRFTPARIRRPSVRRPRSSRISGRMRKRMVRL